MKENIDSNDFTQEVELDVICPLYNAAKYLKEFYYNLIKQKKVKINQIIFSLTESEDNTKDILDELNLPYLSVKKSEFSHSLIRERLIKDYAKSKIVVLLTQDVTLKDEFALYHLTSIINQEVALSFGRQIAYDKGIEKYIRMINYPNYDYIMKKDDIQTHQLKTFYSSDAFAAYNREIFIKLNGYDQQDIPVSEDMYYSYKVITSGYKMAYQSKALANHSHNLKIKEVYQRYVLIGQFFQKYPHFLNYKSGQSGLSLFFKVFWLALKDFNIKVLFRLLPDMAARYLGMKKGLKKKKE